MVSEIKLEFPEFITHIPVSKNKWVKIGYNKIHASVHYTTRAAVAAAMHGFIEKHIPNHLTINAPVETKLTVYAPVNYGVMKMIKDLMNIKIIMESKLMTPELKRQIKVHSDKLIDIDSPSTDGVNV